MNKKKKNESSPDFKKAEFFAYAHLADNFVGITIGTERDNLAHAYLALLEKVEFLEKKWEESANLAHRTAVEYQLLYDTLKQIAKLPMTAEGAWGAVYAAEMVLNTKFPDYPEGK